MSRLIDADALIVAIYNEWDGACVWDASGAETADKFVDEQPTIEERKKGKWIEHENPEGIFSLECPFCKCWFHHEHLSRNSYCPNCGADMNTKGEQK